MSSDDQRVSAEDLVEHATLVSVDILETWAESAWPGENSTAFTRQPVGNSLHWKGKPRHRVNGPGRDRPASRSCPMSPRYPIDDACRIPECGRPIKWKAEQLCSGHAARKRIHGDPLAGGPMRRPRNSNVGAECSVGGCEKQPESRGLCTAHYRRLRLYGDPLGTPPPRVYRKRGPCGVEGCPDPHYTFGYCERHSYRLTKYGDPLGGSDTRRRKVSRPKVRAFIEEALAADHDECIIWPFIRAGDYPAATLDLPGGRETVSVHRHVLAEVAGLPPDDGQKWFACHAPLICHNKLCINPRHLRWDTPQGNSDDRILDGTMSKKRVSPMTGFSRSQVLSLWHDQREPDQLAAIFGLPPGTIRAFKKEQNPACPATT